MSSPAYGFLCNPNLPAEETIVAHCLSLNLPRGTTIVNPSTSSVIAWIKCGPNVTIDEARTQDWTAKALHDAGVSDVQVPRVFHAFTADYFGTSIGYIATEHIDGVDCDSNDVELVAKAVQTLISLQAPPTATLGHFGCGTESIVHSFFPEWLPNAIYQSDQDFCDHIRNIFQYLRINHQGDLSSHDRFLCPSDFNPGNFRKRTTEDGRLVVVVFDFRATCFMPLPFIEVAMKKPRDHFCQSVVNKIAYPQSDDGTALLSASGLLVQYGSKPVALPLGVSSKTNSK
ncbi:hypothetical protein LXA43DRAFT_754108 [Ganoderma leucocontextum]|nr:hypothetical protein LXA43DRAFT_754108 [Ganoderma leucocontextum]